MIKLFYYDNDNDARRGDEVMSNERLALILLEIRGNKYWTGSK